MLPGDQGQPGASRRPPDTAAASSHSGTSPTSGHLEATAALAPATAATASANAETAAAGGTGSTPTPTSSAVNATRTASARPAKRRTQPRTVSDRPPQRRSHRPGTRPGGLRSQRRPDHRHQIRTPQQREHRQQNMRHTTPAAARPPRPDRHRRRITPQHPRPGPPPRPQRPAAIRTRQLIPGKPVLDPGSICPYREHSASARDTALPGRLGQRDTGRAFVCPHRHGAAANEHDHRPRHTPRSVGTQHAWNHTRYQQPQRRSTR